MTPTPILSRVPPSDTTLGETAAAKVMALTRRNWCKLAAVGTLASAWPAAAAQFASGARHPPASESAIPNLGAAVYLVRGSQREARFLRSLDDGKTWNDDTVLNPSGNETAVLHLGRGEWLAASREFKVGPNDLRLEQFVSSDDARTWRRVGPLTLGRQIPGHLLKLRDGRVLLTYGNRSWGNYGVDARGSHDNGKTWGPAFRIATSPFPDSGYPSSLQLPNGSVVTAYYTQTAEGFHYEMRVVRWSPEAAGEMKGLVP